jgi:hypothetical protein
MGKIYNLGGQRVDTILDAYLEAGYYTVRWDGSNFSAGMYFYRVISGVNSKTGKMLLLK